MKSKCIIKKSIATLLSVTMVMSLSACGGADTNNDEGNSSESDTSSQSSEAKAYKDLVLGEDNTDLSADIKFITHKTDIVDTRLREYADQFNELYPNITVEFEGITNYADDFTMRLTTGDWGDICMIPMSVSKDELTNYFLSFGSQEELSENYEGALLNNYSYDSQTYGLPYMATAVGMVYNKAVFEEAGISETPKTPDEFLEALQLIQDNTDAIPLYTNFAAGWTMTAWDAYIDSGATGDPDFVNEGLVKGENPFSDRGDETGPYAVYNTLYSSVEMGLTEDDPTTTDWEGSKGMMNNGEIGVMALGSWAIVQMQEAGDNADDIGYMPFPISVDGEQYALTSPDYNYGINVNSSDENKLASQLFIKFLIEESSFTADEGGISIIKGSEMPSVLDSFSDTTLITNTAAPEGEETLFDDINNESELGINMSGALATEVVENATTGAKTYDELVESWNEKWTNAQEKYGITH
ncbi:MAG: ABC transporter substrate-binding protein [Lachnospirales bacterium]